MPCPPIDSRYFRKSPVCAKAAASPSDRPSPNGSGSSSIVTSVLCPAQSLHNIRNEIGRVLDTDRQSNCGIEDAYSLAHLGRNPGVGHACRQAGKRLGAAQAHGELEDLQRVQEFGCGGLTTDN